MTNVFHKIISAIKLRYFIAKQSIPYTYDYIKLFYKIYLNHEKVIHYRDGYPVYSLSTPAVFSKPMAHLVARSFYRTVQNKNMPNLMSFAVNDTCDAACEHCSFFQGVHNPKKKTVTLDQAKQIIKEAQELGVSMINFVGGEPLLREDLPEIINCVDKTTSSTALFTNGSLLKKMAHILRQNGLDGVYVSIDAANPAKHDFFRKSKGLYDKAIQGILEAKKTGMSVGISTTMTPESYRSGELDKIIELAKTLGVHEVIVFDAMPTGRYKKRKDLIDNHDWVEDMIRHVKQYNENLTYPGILVYAYVTSHRSVGCSCGASYCYISPYGEMMSCDFNHAIFGNVLDEPLYKVWERMTSHEQFASSKWGGCKIKDSTTRNSKDVSDHSCQCS
ncbi:MAG: radical SAM protein [Patescibacteria group bacterium]